MGYCTLHPSPATSASRTSGGLQVQWCVEKFYDPFEVDDYGSDHILNPDSSSRSIPHPTTSMLSHHFRQLPFNGWMLFPHLLIFFGLGLCPGLAVLVLVVVLDHVSSIFNLRLEAVGAQRAILAIRLAKAVLPALIQARPRPIARRLPAGASQLIASFIKLKIDRKSVV